MWRWEAVTVLILVTVAFSGCVDGDVSGAADASRIAFRPCEHPWPCGDGTEWPKDLVAPEVVPEAARLPESLGVKGARVVAHSASSATLAWDVSTVAAVDVQFADVVFNPVTRFEVPVPTGLFLSWSISLELPPDDSMGGRSYDLTLLDHEGNTLCFTDHDLEVAGVSTTGDSSIGCTTLSLQPHDEAVVYALELQHEFDRPGGKVTVLATVEISKPRVAFWRLPVERASVRMSDGVQLDGAIWRPELPPDVRAPIVLVTSPYIGQCSAQSEFRRCGADVASATHLGGYGLSALLDEGYAVALFSVRGTGASGGCYNAWGALEQRDHVELVAWLAAQPWSNGRVGMTGLSYSGTTPWEVAIHDAPALKAIVVGGIISDVYTAGFSPQGAATDGSLYFHGSTAVGNSLTPPRGGGQPTLARYASVAADRACTQAERQLVAHPEAALTDARDEAWFAERRLIDRFPDVTAAALVLHGVEDDNFHRFQEDIIWDALAKSPKAMVLGQWGHTVALGPQLANFDGPKSWFEMSKVWFDFWLKGLGEPPAMLGRVAYQDTAMDWRDAAAWPPTSARDEVLYLAGGALALESGGAASFRALRSPTALLVRAGNPDLCADAARPGGTDARWLAYESSPLSADVVIAGNPMAFLEVTSDQPGGVVMLDLYAIGPDGACIDPTAAGGADLRFHEGNMRGRDFPVGASTGVRVDLYSTAARVPAGHRLVVVLSGGGQDYAQGQPRYAPTLDISGASHIVLPLVEGTLGGQAPHLAYPPRPFTPVHGP